MEYIDLLIVERADSRVAVVVAESLQSQPGNLVEFNSGELGRVVKKAWAGERGGEVHSFVAALVPVYEAEAFYFQSWKQEERDGKNDDNS